MNSFVHYYSAPRGSPHPWICIYRHRQQDQYLRDRFRRPHTSCWVGPGQSPRLVFSRPRGDSFPLPCRRVRVWSCAWPQDLPGGCRKSTSSVTPATAGDQKDQSEGNKRTTRAGALHVFLRASLIQCAPGYSLTSRQCTSQPTRNRNIRITVYPDTTGVKVQSRGASRMKVLEPLNCSRPVGCALSYAPGHSG